MPSLNDRRVRYFLWAAARSLSPDTTCSGCGRPGAALVRRKYVVTALRECTACGLRFRTPKDDASRAEEFYQSDYDQGFTTDCPPDSELERLKASKFAGCERDYARYIDFLAAAGVRPGQAIADFGCSWGYGSWQFRQAGYRVYSYEISRPRARYAQTKLGCTMIDSFDNVPEKLDCFFSAHVIEHLTDPNVIWENAKKVLKPGGTMIVFCPNGDPAFEAKAFYHQMWGQVHPLMITTRFFESASARHGFDVAGVYHKPYDLTEIAEGRPQSPTVVEDELCLIARLKK